MCFSLYHFSSNIYTLLFLKSVQGFMMQSIIFRISTYAHARSHLEYVRSAITQTTQKDNVLSGCSLKLLQ